MITWRDGHLNSSDSEKRAILFSFVSLELCHRRLSINVIFFRAYKVNRLFFTEYLLGQAEGLTRTTEAAFISFNSLC